MPEETPPAPYGRGSWRGCYRTGANEGSEGSASRVYQLNASEPSYRLIQRVRCPRPPKPKYLPYSCIGKEGSWINIEMYDLPGEWPFMWVGTACGGQVIPRRNSNVSLTHKGSADEAVVVLKRFAVEGMVTCPRVNQTDSDRKSRRRAEHENDGRYSIKIYCHEISIN